MNSAGARYTDIETGEVSMPTIEQNNIGVLISDALDSVHIFPSYTQPLVLTPEEDKEIEKILKEATEHYKKKGLI